MCAGSVLSFVDLDGDWHTELLVERVLAIEHQHEPELDSAAVRAAFTALVDACRPPLAAASTAEDRVAVLNRLVLTERRVSYRSQLVWRDATLAAALIRGQCNCLGGSVLYAAVADALRLPVHLVLMPTHAFVRWDDGTRRINIETTDGGVRLDDDHYLYTVGRCDPEDTKALGYGASLDGDHVEAALLDSAAVTARREGRNDEELALLARAVELAPERTDLALQLLRAQAMQHGQRAAALAAVRRLARDPKAQRLLKRARADLSPSP